MDRPMRSEHSPEISARKIPRASFFTSKRRSGLIRNVTLILSPSKRPSRQSSTFSRALRLYNGAVPIILSVPNQRCTKRSIRVVPIFATLTRARRDKRRRRHRRDSGAREP